MTYILIIFPLWLMMIAMLVVTKKDGGEISSIDIIGLVIVSGTLLAMVKFNIYDNFTW